MPDVVADDPAVYGAGVPDLTEADSADFAIHNEARSALRALNRLLFAERGHRGLTIRSVGRGRCRP